MADRRTLTLIVVPDGARESRTFRVSHRRLRFLAALALVLGLLVVGLAGSWWYLATRSARVTVLEEEVERLRADRARVAALATRLEEVERRYDRIRGLFGSDAGTGAADLWLPPPGSGGAGVASETDLEGALPTSWPLADRGFVTQPLLEAPGGAEEGHPGLDIAVATDTYIRAAGAGSVVEAGEDEVYGFYVVIDHGNGYRSRYAHASDIFVQEGRTVLRNEVIGLTGSTGRSTAPHLHFEVLLDRQPVDPLTLVRRPS